MQLKWGMFRKTGDVVKSEPLENGGRRITVQLSGGGEATIDLNQGDLRVIVGPPVGIGR